MNWPGTNAVAAPSARANARCRTLGASMRLATRRSGNSLITARKPSGGRSRLY